jgi:O-antigen ligase
MESFIVASFFFLRGIFCIDTGVKIAGVDFFDMANIMFTCLLALLWLAKAARKQTQPLSAIDISILLFCGWCFFASLLYLEAALLRDVVKFTLPPLTYIFLKSLMFNSKHYKKCLYLLILGLSIPTIISAVMVARGIGLDKVDYWTGLARYQGIFVNPHNFGHTMAFLAMAIVLYCGLHGTGRELLFAKFPLNKKIILFVIGFIALYCLYQSYVRTAWLGLVIFASSLTFFVSRKKFAMFLLIAVVVTALSIPLLKLVFHDVVEVTEGKRETERIGSGRPYIWKHNLMQFSKVGLDRQLAGVGIGNRVGIFREEHSSDNIWNSHNDFLEVMIQTGIVGLCLFCSIQYFFLRRILSLERREKYLFMSLFISVMFMNFMSNSYVVRFSIGQMYYMVMAYIESKSLSEV